MQTFAFWGLLLTTGFVAANVMANETQPASDEAATTALELARQGQSLVKAGKPAKAVEVLNQAVTLSPKSAEFRNQLALAYYHTGQMSEMWKQLRTGAKIDPNHKQIAKGLLAYWNVFDKQGLFNAGVPIQRVRESLGEPDYDLKNNSDNDRGRLVYGFLAIDHRGGRVHESLDLRGLSPEHFTPQEIILVDLDGRGWKPTYRVNNRYTATAEYTLPGEQVQNWTELVSVQRLHRRASGAPSIRGVADGMMTSLRKTHPDAEYHILDQDDTSILLEWFTKGNEQTAAQHEIVRLFKAQRDIHRVAYVHKTTTLDSEQRQKWIEILREAELDPVKAIHAAGDSNAAASSEHGNRHLAAFEYGSVLSGAAIMHFQGADAARIETAVRRAKEIGASLDLEPPTFETEHSGNDALDAANCMQYCLAKAGVPAFQKLYTVGGKPSAALLEVSIKSNLLILIYAPNDSSGKTLATALRERAPDTGLPEELWLPVIEMVESNQDRADVVKQVLAMHTAVRRHLSAH